MNIYLYIKDLYILYFLFFYADCFAQNSLFLFFKNSKTPKKFFSHIYLTANLHKKYLSPLDWRKKMNNSTAVLLKFAIQKGILSIEDVESLGKDDKLKKIEKEITKVHPYKIYAEGERWRTYIEDLSKKNGRKPIVRKNKEDLLLFLVKHYEIAPELIAEDCKTFSEVFDLVWEEKAEFIETKEDRISFENTKIRNYSAFRRYISGTFIENMHVNQITKDDLDRLFILNLRRYKMKSSALGDLRCIVGPVLRYAFSKYWINDNPYERIVFKNYDKLLFKDKTKLSDRAHSAEEIEMILNGTREKQKKYPKTSSHWALEFQIISALRRGEIPPLSWDDVKDIYIDIHQEQLFDTKNNSFEIVPKTKTSTDRDVVIGRDLSEFLERLKERNEKYYPDSNYLFPSKYSKNGVITNRAVYDVYRDLCDELGIEKINNEVIRGPHSFRRNSITSFINNGGSIEMAAILHGNSPDVIKKNYFTGADLEKMLEIVDKRTLNQ